MFAAPNISKRFLTKGLAMDTTEALHVCDIRYKNLFTLKALCSPRKHVKKNALITTSIRDVQLV